MRTLVVDDDLIARLLLIEFLLDYGTCESVVDGEEAVRAYRLAIQRNRAYDLILLDVMMPKMDGIEALSKIREIEKEHNIPPEKQVKIIMISAKVDELTKETAHTAECSAYLTKPVDHDELVNKFTELKLI